MTELPGAALEAQTVASILGRAYVNANATRARSRLSLVRGVFT
jgi:hypothetical protein